MADTDSASPAIDNLAGNGGGSCGVCGHHDRARSADWIERIMAKFGRQPEPECPWQAAAMADVCGCTEPYHSR